MAESLTTGRYFNGRRSIPMNDAVLTASASSIAVQTSALPSVPNKYARRWSVVLASKKSFWLAATFSLKATITRSLRPAIVACFQLYSL